jgi:hypothetical protein
MAAYSALIAYIQSFVKENANEEITGAIMQSTLLNMVSELGIREFRGVATPTTHPALPNGQAIYIASTQGSYQYFNITISADELALIIWDSNSEVWIKEAIINNGHTHITEGAKASSTDAGTFGQMSLTDDYLYICVQSGTAGSAIWKKTSLSQT